MRNINVPDVVFTDREGNQFKIKAMREYPDYDTARSITIKRGDYIDEVCTREDVFKQGGEDQSFTIFEHNVVELTDNRFDLGKMPKLKIPVVTSL